MRSFTAVVLLVVATVLVMSELTAAGRSPNGRYCNQYTNCRSKCCLNNVCIENSNWCPCSVSKNPCNQISQVCVPKEVQCVRAPCYPIADCQPRFLPVTPILP